MGRGPPKYVTDGVTDRFYSRVTIRQESPSAQGGQRKNDPAPAEAGRGCGSLGQTRRVGMRCSPSVATRYAVWIVPAVMATIAESARKVMGSSFRSSPLSRLQLSSTIKDNFIESVAFLHGSTAACNAAGIGGTGHRGRRRRRDGHHPVGGVAATEIARTRSRSRASRTRGPGGEADRG